MTTEDVPALYPTERAEIVYESAHVRITRRLVFGRSVIRKQLLGPDAERRRRREVGILQRLRGVEGLTQLVDRPRYGDSLVLADAGSTTLAALATPLAADELLGLASGLARAVAGMHRRGVLHRDLSPANIVALRRRRPDPGRLRAGDLGGRAAPRVHPSHRDHRHAGLPGAGGHRTHRAAGRPAGRPVRPGRDAVRAGHRCPTVRHRRPAGPDPRPPGPHADTPGRTEPGRSGAAVADHPAPAGKGARPPLPDR